MILDIPALLAVAIKLSKGVQSKVPLDGSRLSQYVPVCGPPAAVLPRVPNGTGTCHFVVVVVIVIPKNDAEMDDGTVCEASCVVL